ncbi:hypothetical protein QBC44DRAFT_266292 [Cladorrhinum sp. PSN332]|nr:hypothetical protein QBC44DRAFT_266292 [Cladorrhinum sp. PSN332]
MATRAVEQAVEKTYKTFREIHGVVVSAGLIDKTVKVRVGGQKWNKFIKKHFNTPQTHLVHDPRNSLRQGDVVAITPGWRTSKDKRHVVKHIIAPGSGTAIGDRPPIPTWEELHAEVERKRAAKLERRTLRTEVERAEAKFERVRREATHLGKELAQWSRIVEERKAARELREKKLAGEA